MNRVTAREIAVQAVYALGFCQSYDELSEERTGPAFYEAMHGEDALFEKAPGVEEAEYIRDIIRGVEIHHRELDEQIIRHAKGWQLGRIPRVAAAIMRVCMYELLYRPDIPERAAINAAVEICKHYEPKEITAYINGILGSFIRELRPESAGAALAEAEGEAPTETAGDIQTLPQTAQDPAPPPAQADEAPLVRENAEAAAGFPGGVP